MGERKQARVIAALLTGLGMLIAGMGLARLSMAADSPAGKVVFEKRCGGCHALDRDKEGPRLAGVYGRAAGSVSSFQYSAALLKSNILWTEKTLDLWLTDPDKFIPQNEMSFRVTSEEERKEIIAYLKTNPGQ